MREIKFRAWHRTAKQMLSENYEGEVFIWKHQKQPLDIMQFTGLKDKNGKEIYEGDIVRFQSIEGVIEYTKDCAFEVMRKVGTTDSVTIEEGEPLSHNYEIIGNLYEHPKLIKGGEK